MSKFHPIQNIDKHAILISNCLNDPESILESVSSKVWGIDYKQGGKMFGDICYISYDEPKYSDIHEAMLKAADIFLSLDGRNISDYEYKDSFYKIFKWHTPMEAMGQHPDKWEENGQPVIPDISLVMYLTDDFDGGDLVFKEFDITVKPKAGDIVVFNSNISHGVSEVLAGRRITIQLFLFKK
jgi:hypothetical protein